MEIISGVHVGRLTRNTRQLIGNSPDALVRIDRATAGNAGYRVNKRTFAKIRDFWLGDWQDFLILDLTRVAYSGASANSRQMSHFGARPCRVASQRQPTNPSATPNAGPAYGAATVSSIA